MLPTILASTSSTKKDNDKKISDRYLSLKPTSNFNVNISPQSLHKKTKIKRISVKRPIPLKDQLESPDFIPANLHSPITNISNSKQQL
jgi:hypothetical protein